jgi:hypothetical protein
MCKTIKHRVRFKIPPETIYELLADSCRRSEITGRKAVMSDKVGGKVSTDAGQVTGVNVDLVPGRRLVQAWRRKDFPRVSIRWRPLRSRPFPAAGRNSCSPIEACPNICSNRIEDYWRFVYLAPMRAQR